MFGYETYIDSPDIAYKNIRLIKKNDKHNFDKRTENYSFDIKRDGQDIDHIEMNVGWSPSLTIWSNKYGFINFYIDYHGLFLNFKSKTDKYNIEEVLIYKDCNNKEHYNDREYVYQIGYSKKDIELSDDNSKGRTTREISGIQHYDEDNQLVVFERTWVNGTLRTYKKGIVSGTIEEMASKNEMGIDCFNHFRYLLNEIIPFKNDVLSLMISDDNIKEKNVGIFFQDYEKENNQVKKQKK